MSHEMTPAQIVHCECGTIIGERCAWEGPAAETVIVEFVPADRVDEWRIARRPDSFFRRARCERSCAERLVSADGEDDDDDDDAGPPEHIRIAERYWQS